MRRAEGFRQGFVCPAPLVTSPLDSASVVAALGSGGGLPSPDTQAHLLLPGSSESRQALAVGSQEAERSAPIFGSKGRTSFQRELELLSTFLVSASWEHMTQAFCEPLTPQPWQGGESGRGCRSWHDGGRFKPVCEDISGQCHSQLAILGKGAGMRGSFIHVFQPACIGQAHEHLSGVHHIMS